MSAPFRPVIQCILVLMLLEGVLSAADVQLYALTRTISNRQSSTAPATTLPTAAYTFAAIIVPATSASVVTATLSKPNAVNHTYTTYPGSTTLGVGGQFDTKSAMDALYMDGTYGIQMTTQNDGQRNTYLNLGPEVFPNTPQVTNFPAAQTINATQAFTVTWSPFSGGGTDDFIQLIIRRANGTTLYATPSVGQTGALNGTVTQTTIPAGTFIPAQVYTATLIYTNVVAGFLYGYGYPITVPNATTYTKTTEFTMTAPGTKPILSITTGTPAGSVLLSWNADIGRTYDLRSSTDLVTWNSVSLLTAATTSLQYTHTPSGTQVFYRLQAPP